MKPFWLILGVGAGLAAYFFYTKKKEQNAATANLVSGLDPLQSPAFRPTLSGY